MANLSENSPARPALEIIMTAQNVEQLRERLARAESERDVWTGKSEHQYKMACTMAAALRKQLAVAERAQP
jgi:hypothetical protein